MPALIPVDNTLGALFIGTVLSSILFGVTWLQVYYYYDDHCSRDRWPLKSFVAFLMLVDTANLALVIYGSYRVVITNFGDYQFNTFTTVSWGQSAVTLSAIVIDVSVQHFYAYRIYHLGGRSPYLPAAISVVSLTGLSFGTAYSTEVLHHTHDLSHSFEFSVSSLSCKVLCDVLITVGMVYYLLSNRTQVRRINNVLNLLAIYFINCGTLHLVFSISCVTLMAMSRDTLIYIPSLFIMVRLSLCAFMAILNSRDYLRETLDGPEGLVTLTQLEVRTVTTVPWGAQDTAEAIANKAIPKSHLPLSVPSDTSSSDSVTAFEEGTTHAL
ncbi:hypothetical protein EDB85DRAFT_145756 [Lactarius pseudohatsudake]|nr:hypothetical protein EDB85DRAFT_145756 [Lactarius pseudohatsudake]